MLKLKDLLDEGDTPPFKPTKGVKVKVISDDPDWKGQSGVVYNVAGRYATLKMDNGETLRVMADEIAPV